MNLNIGHFPNLALLAAFSTVTVILTSILQAAGTTSPLSKPTVLSKYFHTEIQLSKSLIEERNATMGDDTQVYLVYMNTYCTATYKWFEEHKHDEDGGGTSRWIPQNAGNGTQPISYDSLQCAEPSFGFWFNISEIIGPSSNNTSSDTLQSAQCTKDLNGIKSRSELLRRLGLALPIMYTILLLACLYLLLLPAGWYPPFLPPFVPRLYFLFANLSGLILIAVYYATRTALKKNYNRALVSCLALTPTTSPKHAGNVLVFQDNYDTEEFTDFAGVVTGILFMCLFGLFFSLYYSCWAKDCCGGAMEKEYDDRFWYWTGFYGDSPLDSWNYGGGGGHYGGYYGGHGGAGGGYDGGCDGDGGDGGGGGN